MGGKETDLNTLIEPRHHRAEILFGVLAFATALFLASQIGSQLVWKPGQVLARQPGLWSVIAIVGMLIFGLFELYHAWRRNASGRGDSIAAEAVDWLRAIEFAGWFMAYVLAVPAIGYLPATLVFCLTLTLRLGYRGTRHILAALLTGLVTVILFKSLLSVKIPGGAVYEILPDALRNFMILYL